jgi:hypothetical protein
MTSLSEVYEPDAEYETSLRRLYAGLGLFSLGTLLVVAGIVVGSTGVYGSGAESRELAGVLAGFGVPAVFTGIFAVLPAGRRTRAAAGVGAAVAVFGVALFVHAYPCQWVGSNCLEGRTLLTLPVAVVYFSGVITTFFCLFVGVANFKSRNNPGGTAKIEVTAQGETRIIEVPKSELSKFGGSLGVLGNTPDVGDQRRPEQGDAISDGGADDRVVTEVTDDDAIVQRSGPSTPSAPDGSSGPAGQRSQGGKQGARQPSARRVDISHRQTTGSDRDRYCGSCQHFQYVQTDHGMQPYCGAHDDLMDDMEACSQYRPRSEN